MVNGMEPPRVPGSFLNDGTYNLLKTLALVVLPAAASLYFGLSQIWGLPHAEKVLGTVSVTETFLGVLLGLSSSRFHTNVAYAKASGAYYDGVAEVHDDGSEEGPALAIKFNNQAVDIPEKNEIVLRVIKRQPYRHSP
jgi:hypothetical protein